MSCVALLIRDSYQEVARYLAIHFEVPHLTAWIAQPIGDDIGVSGRTDNSACWVQFTNCAIRQITKRRDVERNAIVEKSGSALYQGLAITGQCEDEAGARSCIYRFGDRVTIKTKTQVEGQAI